MVAAADPVDIDGGVRVPDEVGGPVVGRSGDSVSELLDVGERDPTLLRFGGELDCGDLVAVLDQVRRP